MCKYIKNWIVIKLIEVLAVGTAFLVMPFYSGNQAAAFTLIEAGTTAINSHSISSDSFDPALGQNTTISYCLSGPATVNVGIYKAGGTSSQKVAILASNQSKNGGCYTAIWNGQHDSYSEIANQGEIVDNGQYFYYIEAKGAYSTSSASNWITVGDGPNFGSVKFIDVQVDNPVFDPWDSQEAAIEFTTAKDGYVTLQINDADNQKVIRLLDGKWYEKGEYTVYWNGEDELGEIVAQDEYSYSIKITKGEETAKKTGKLVVKKGYNDQTDQTVDPRIENHYVTKEEFDPGRKEKEYIVYTLTAEADVQVGIYDKDENLVRKLANEKDQAPGTYQIQWDGAEAMDQKATYSYKIYATNSSGEDTKKGKIKVAEDRSEKSIANVYKDSVNSIPFNPNNGELGIYFTLEKAATVTVEIRDAKHLITTVAKDVQLPEGTHTVYWDGNDKYGNAADEGVYSYKIMAKNLSGKETEQGNFSLGNATEAKYKTELCGQFKDVSTNYQYCEAIEWTVGEGVFQGYNDGFFKPNQVISRAEALKVIMKSLKIQLMSAYGEKLGFNDTDSTQWYGTYVKTGVALGIIHGYKDGSFRPNQIVTHSEAQTMLFRAASVKDGMSFFDNDFNPSAPMTRGEMADMLYRYDQTKYDSN